MQIVLNQGLFPWRSYKQDLFTHILKLFLVLECEYSFLITLSSLIFSLSKHPLLLDSSRISKKKNKTGHFVLKWKNIKCQKNSK